MYRPVSQAQAYTQIDRASAASGDIPYQSTRAAANHVDPRLSISAVKAKPVSRSATPFVDPMSLLSTYGPPPPLPLWSASHYANGLPGLLHVDDGESSSENSYLQPPGNCRQQDRDSHSTTTGELVDADAGILNDGNKLKGILWPGMSLFDSATPDMRRKRNQKKANSVVEHLEAMSQGIEATELVFSPAGSLKRARAISGLPDPDSSPLKGEESPPKSRVTTRKPRRRQALAEKDPNTSRRPRGATQTRSQQALPFYGSERRSYLGDDDDAADALTYSIKHDENTAMKSTKRKKKSALVVYKDDDEKASLEHHEHEHEHEHLSYLTSAFRQRSHSIGADASRNAAPMQFRPSDVAHYSHQTFDGYPHSSSFHANGLPDPFAYETALLPAWDFLGQDVTGHMSNPLFMGSQVADLDEDDERTISALQSESVGDAC